MERSLTIAADHPAYAGHFPGNPLLPGVVLLAEAMAALGVAQHTIDAAKFLAPVTPGTPLTLRDEAAGPAGLRLTIASPMGLVATATLSPP